MTKTRYGIGAIASLVVVATFLMPAVAWGQDETTHLKEQLALQQEQIEQLRAALDEQKRLLQEVIGALNPSGTSEAARAQEPSSALVASVTPVVPRGSSAAGASAGPTLPASGGMVSPEALNAMQTQMAAVTASAAQTEAKVTSLESAFNDSQKSTEGLKKQLGNLSLSGDVRMRYEPFIQDGAPTRQRERMRARLNLTGKLTDEISGGISVATGSLDDVNSTNQTLTGFFTRKSIGFDRYYLTYKPKWFKPLGLAAGKFVSPWYRTPLTFDNDVNPEGFAQTLSFDLKSPVLKNITFVGFELPFNEASGSYDSFIFGGQLQTRWKLSEKANLALYASGVNFNRADPIAVAIAGGTLRPSLANTNTFRTDSNGNVIGYASKFAYLDLIGVLDYKWSGRWPMMLMFNLVNNTRAATDQRTAYWAEVDLGQLKEQKDVQFGYSYIWLERDAVIGAFNESDLRASTNVKNHRVQFGYQSFNNVTMQWTMWLGKLADPFQNTSLVPSGIRSNCTTAPFTDCRDSLLNRMQFDVTYKF